MRWWRRGTWLMSSGGWRKSCTWKFKSMCSYTGWYLLYIWKKTDQLQLTTKKRTKFFSMVLREYIFFFFFNDGGWVGGVRIFGDSRLPCAQIRTPKVPKTCSWIWCFKWRALFQDPFRGEKVWKLHVYLTKLWKLNSCLIYLPTDSNRFHSNRHTLPAFTRSFCEIRDNTDVQERATNIRNR